MPTIEQALPDGGFPRSHLCEDMLAAIARSKVVMKRANAAAAALSALWAGSAGSRNGNSD